MNSISTTLLRIALALGLSFALWTFVSFSQNPEELVRFDDVTLQIVGLGPDLLLVDTNGLPNPTLPSIDIMLRTDRAQRNDLRPIDIRAVIDLTNLGPGDHLVPVNVQPTRNISFSMPNNGVEPAAVPIRLEQETTSSVPIQLEILGNLPFSFERGEPTIRHNETGEAIAVVAVTGPQNRVERVVAARAIANVEQLRVSYDAPLQLAPVDERDDVVTGVQIVPPAVRVLIPINSVVGLRLVPIAPMITGRPAAGYAVAAIEVVPPLITLTGSSGPLNAVNSLSTTPIDLNGANSTIETTAAIIFPPGTSAQIGQPTQVEVTIRLAPVDRPFQVQLPAQVNLVGANGGLLFSVNPTIVSVDVAGPVTALNALAQEPLRADVDVSGLGPGTYTLNAIVDLPANVTVVGEPPTVTVTIRPAPAPPTATSEPTPTEASPVDPTPTATAPAPEPTLSPEATPLPTTEPAPTPTATTP
jgi:YbbR domain-containing protein